MFQDEDVRTAAKLNRPPSKVYLCQEERDRARSAGRRPKSPTRFDGTPVELPGFMKSNYFLHHEDLDMGQKQYIWGVARIYSVTQLMSLKQRQYQSLLDYEFARRIQNKELKEHERVKEWKEYQRYCKFIKRYDQVKKSLCYNLWTCLGDVNDLSGCEEPQTIQVAFKPRPMSCLHKLIKKLIVHSQSKDVVIKCFPGFYLQILLSLCAQH